MSSPLAYYGLPGHVTSITTLGEEVADGARLGFGAVLVSERLNVKESAVLAGYAAALAGPDMEVATALTFPTTRHPVELAAYGATAAGLARGGFTLGLGRGTAHMWGTWQERGPTLAVLEDTAQVLKRLWTSETISGHDGPLGRFPGDLALGVELQHLPRLGLGTLGPKSMELAGRAYDDLFLHTHWTNQGIASSAATTRKAADEAGRDPDSLRIWAMLAVACDLPEEAVLQRVVPPHDHLPAVAGVRRDDRRGQRLGSCRASTPSHPPPARGSDGRHDPVQRRRAAPDP